MKEERAAFVVAGSLLTLAWALPAVAYRPFDGTDADVAEPREIELELGPIGYQREASEHLLVAPSVVLNYGLAPRFEAVLEGRQQWALASSHQAEFEHAALSLKSLLREGSMQGARGVSVAVETGALLPGTERRFGLHVASIFSWCWPALTLHLNVGNDLLTSVHYAASTSLILEGPTAWAVRPVTEVFFEREFGSPKLTHGLEESLLVGAIARVNDAWTFDAGLRHGRLDGVLLQEARLGLTWAFNAW